MTQCLLTHILIDHHHRSSSFTPERIESVYRDCRREDAFLDGLAATEDDHHLVRRLLVVDYRNYSKANRSFCFATAVDSCLLLSNGIEFSENDRFLPAAKLKNLFRDLDRPFGVPYPMQHNRLEATPPRVKNMLQLSTPHNTAVRGATKELFAEESIMRKAST